MKKQVQDFNDRGDSGALPDLALRCATLDFHLELSLFNFPETLPSTLVSDKFREERAMGQRTGNMNGRGIHLFDVSRLYRAHLWSHLDQDLSRIPKDLSRLGLSLFNSQVTDQGTWAINSLQALSQHYLMSTPYLAPRLPG